MNKYVRLTVGDGLVSQVPALLISTATGLVVTRAASEASLGKDFVQQIFGNYPKLLYIVGGVITLMGIATPLPTARFLILGFIFVLMGYLMDKDPDEEVDEPIEEISQAE